MAAASDNTAMESFFTLLQKNILDHHCWATREQLHITITTRTKHTYHHHHQQTTLNRLTPIEFKATINTPTPLAARPQPATYPYSSPVLDHDSGFTITSNTHNIITKLDGTKH